MQFTGKPIYREVLHIQVLAYTSREGVPEEQFRPLLKMELDNGTQFVMSGIPVDIAYAISQELAGGESPDSRLQAYQLVSELALISRVNVDQVVPGTSVYSASILLQPEGFQKELKFDMIPSHAILLALTQDAMIFVDQSLVME